MAETWYKTHHHNHHNHHNHHTTTTTPQPPPTNHPPAQVAETWYKTDAKKGVLLVVTAAKEGAISGGKDFIAVSPQIKHTV